MKTIAIIGASGFIGRNLVASLILLGQYKIRILSRDSFLDVDIQESDLLEVRDGDLNDIDSLLRFLEPQFIVINLVYLWSGGIDLNLSIINNLLDACKRVGIARLVHCSTAAVYGRVFDESITEKNVCFPISEYGVVKLQTEKLIQSISMNNFEVAILRPTSVFGVGGDPLKKMVVNILNHPLLNP